MIEQLADLRLLHDLPGVHHHDPLAHLGDHAEVVGHQQDAHPELGLHARQQLEDLRLDRHVQGGGRLVGDQQ
ncbi:hypothetical protein [Pseudonocardia sp. UM4_GMWB1]|uniref:hypothetical protein n=1 Tax=Pseudonocardia sp. UM4_GMWB1 TaxID=2212989 RepID=UPI00307D692A